MRLTDTHTDNAKTITPTADTGCNKHLENYVISNTSSLINPKMIDLAQTCIAIQIPENLMSMFECLD